jgi:uncharacterized LabA/DUF88 family protein
MIEWNNYDKAVIISSDGDFFSLVQHLFALNKLETVLSPDERNCSTLLKRAAEYRIRYMYNLEQKLSYKRKAPLKDGTLRGTSH